jgi:hypothetical protein
MMAAVSGGWMVQATYRSVAVDSTNRGDDDAR